jgi:hypothetical protein
MDIERVLHTDSENILIMNLLINTILIVNNKSILSR